MSNFIKNFFSPNTGNPNTDSKSKRNRIAIVVAVLMLCLFIYGLHSHKQSKLKKLQEQRDIRAQVTNIVDDEYGEDNVKSALEEQQKQMDKQQKIIKELSDQIKEMNSNLSEVKDSSSKDREQLETEIQQKQKQLEKAIEDKTKAIKQTDNILDGSTSGSSNDNSSQNMNAMGGGSAVPNTNYHVAIHKAPSISGFDFVYDTEEEDEETFQNYRNWIPTGTYCKAILLTGGEVDAGVMGSANTTPMLLKIVGNCYMPGNKQTYKLKNAHITASAYGDISSERARFRLDSLSMVNRKDGTVIDLPVEGFITDISGKNGYSGVPVLRNGKIFNTAEFVALVNGLGKAESSVGSTTTTGTSTTTSVNPGQAAGKAVGESLSSGAQTVGNYYAKILDMYIPDIEIQPGGLTDVIFIQKFPIENKKAIDKYSQSISEARKAKLQPQQSPAMSIMSQASNIKPNDSDVKDQAKDKVTSQLQSIQEGNLV